MVCQHGASKYRNDGCRCEVCTADNTTRHRREVAARHARRVEIDGVLVAPEVQHGTLYAYKEHGCRCADCVAINSQASAAHRLRVRQAPSTNGGPA